MKVKLKSTKKNSLKNHKRVKASSPLTGMLFAKLHFTWDFEEDLSNKSPGMGRGAWMGKWV
jgi:hypothetical protein